MAKTIIKHKQIEKITSQNIEGVIDNSAIPANKLAAFNTNNLLTDQHLRYLVGVKAAVQAQIDSKLASSVLKKAADTIDWSSDLIAVTAKAISQKIADEVAQAEIGGSMQFKGEWSQANLSTAKAGYTYVYDFGTPPAAHVMEAGDMIIVKVDNPTITNTDHFSVVQTNIDGAVTYVGQAVTDGGIVVFDGTTGRMVKGNAVSGLLKLVNGVPAVADESDLPHHKHPVKISVGNVTGSIVDLLNIVEGSLINVSWDDASKSLNISSTLTITNGTPQAGKFVSGMNVDADGNVSLFFDTLPIVSPKSEWKSGVAPSGAINGSNRVFIIAENIVSGTEVVIVNGQVLTRSIDYGISGRTITLAADAYIPISGDIVRVNYVKA